MPGYADVEDPVALLNRAPDTSGGPTVEDAVREAGFEVQAVDWVWRKVVGESLVDSIIKPITGDFEKISQQAGEWKNVKDALQAIRNNLNAGLDELQPAWNGEAADKFRNLIGTTWTLGIEADAQAANLIGFALGKVAEGSKRACDQALHLIKMLVDKLIEAAAMLPIPVVGWGRAVKLVYDGIQIYNAIMQLIEGIKAIIEGAQQVIQGVQQVGTALSKIKDIHNLNDALNVANEAGEGVANIHSGAQNIKDGATQVTGAAGDLAQHGRSAHDNARGLHDERAAARDQGGTDPSGSPQPGSRRQGDQTQGDGTNRPQNPNDTRTPEQARRACGDPIDVVTGEMFLGQTDIELAGVLPLILRRTHISSYRAGRLFGRSWASTLDQRLEFDSQGAVFVADDGMLLVYPEATRAGVLPQVGPRWPLSTTDIGFAVSKPESGQKLSFTANGALESITDRNGTRIDVLRDAQGLPTEVRHSGGYRIAVRNTGGLVTGMRLVSHNGTGDVDLMSYRYDSAGRLVEVINSSNRSLRFDYDSAGRIVRWEDRNGQWYAYTYDERGRCVRTESSGGFLAGSFEYQDRVTIYTDSLGHQRHFHLNEAGQIVREIDPLGNATVSEWDAYDRLLSRTDPLGRSTTYTRDADGNLTGLLHPDGTRASASYNALGLPVTVTDPDGAVWNREYDERGNLAALTDPAGATTRYRHTADGRLESITDPVGNTRRLETNAAGLPVAITDGLGAITRYVRDVFGRVAQIVDPVGGVTRLGWTVEGKLISRTLPDGATERWRYDGEGNQLEYIDATGQATRTEYVNFDMPAVRTDPDGVRYEFAYDTELRLLSVTNPQGLAWRYDYDAAGRVISETDFNGRTVGYLHDAAGRLVERTNGAGERVRFDRDELGQITAKHAGDAVTTFEYDAMGRLARAANPDAEVIVERDAAGRVLSDTVNGRTVSSAYDPAGRRTRRMTPSGAESAWEYDANGRVIALHTAGNTMKFAHDPAGREVQRTLGGAAVLAQTWDANHRLATQTVTGPRPGQPVQRRAYDYRPDGYLVGIQDQLAGSRRFDLDAAGRIIAVHGTGWTERYAYDPAGNITAAAWPLPAGTTEGGTQGAREYAGTRIRRAGNVHYEHDAQGRLAVRQHRTLSGKTLSWHYTWDADDRLVEVRTPDGARWRYRYDALGRRIAKQRLGTDTEEILEQVDFTWDGDVLAEQTHGGDSATTWNWEPGGYRPLTQTERASLRDAPQEWVDREFYALITDLVGTPTEMVDREGNIAWRGQTTVWGAALAALDGGPRCPLRFPGQYYDAETGDHYNYFRHYDPSTGRYNSNDPVDLDGGPNPHAYVSNPFIWLDPLGLTPCIYSRMEGTQDPRDIGSTIPKSYNLTTANGQQVWVNPNATKHMWEETRGMGFSRSVAEQVRLRDLGDAVDAATANGIPRYEQMVISNGWELIFSAPRQEGLNPVLKHARHLGGA